MKKLLISTGSIILFSTILLLGFVTPASAVPSIVAVTVTRVPDGVSLRFTALMSRDDRDISRCGGRSSYTAICTMDINVELESGRVITYTRYSGGLTNSDTYVTYGALTGNFQHANNGGAIFRSPMLINNWVIPTTAGTVKCIFFSMSDNMITPPTSHVRLPGGCTPVAPPPLPVTCEFNAVGDSTINYGSLADTALNGAQASTQINIRCTNADTNPTTLTVKASGDNLGWGINLRPAPSNELYTKIAINGQAASIGGTTVQVNRENFTIDIRSTLITYGTTPPAPGPFSGSTVITISPP